MKRTRTALLMSVLALLLCASMFVGSTFAWFTDSVSSTNNIITAGNLDVTLEYYDSVAKAWVEVDRGQSVFDETTLWEPGHVEIVALRVANAGTLALKYNLSTVVAEELGSTNVYGNAFKLSDYLVVRGGAFAEETAALAKIADRATARTLSDGYAFGADLVPEDSLLNKGEADYFVLAVEMPETVGNEANHKTGVAAPKITFGITVVATQEVKENDSFGNDYDEDAKIVVVENSNEIKEAVKVPNAVVKVAAGTYEALSGTFAEGVVMECEEGTVFEGTSGLNINGATVVGATFDAGASDTSATGTINGTFKDCTFTGGSEGVRWCYTSAGETVVFENCVFETSFRGFHTDGGEGDIIFRNCTLSGFNAFGGDYTLTLEGCTMTDGTSSYNGLNLYVDTVITDCKFVFESGDTNFIDMEEAGKTITITNSTATLDGVDTPVKTFVGGSKLANCTFVLDGVTQ